MNVPVSNLSLERTSKSSFQTTVDPSPADYINLPCSGVFTPEQKNNFEKYPLCSSSAAYNLPNEIKDILEPQFQKYINNINKEIEYQNKMTYFFSIVLMVVMLIVLIHGITNK